MQYLTVQFYISYGSPYLGHLCPCQYCEHLIVPCMRYLHPLGLIWLVVVIVGYDLGRIIGTELLSL